MSPGQPEDEGLGGPEQADPRQEDTQLGEALLRRRFAAVRLEQGLEEEEDPDRNCRTKSTAVSFTI